MKALNTFTHTLNEFEHVWSEYARHSSCQLSFLRTEPAVVGSLLLSANAMASVIGLPIRCSRLKIANFKQLARNFGTNSTISARPNSRQSNLWWYLLGGSVCAGVYVKSQQSSMVTAFNPKKIKVSVTKLNCYMLNGFWWCRDVLLCIISLMQCGIRH